MLYVVYVARNEIGWVVLEGTKPRNKDDIEMLHTRIAQKDAAGSEAVVVNWKELS